MSSKRKNRSKKKKKGPKNKAKTIDKQTFEKVRLEKEKKLLNLNLYLKKKFQI